MWENDVVDDLVDGVCSNEYFRKKIIFTNNKACKRTEIYKIVKEVKEHCKDNGKMVSFSVEQTRAKFKLCVGICKHAAMVQKTDSGINNLIDEKGNGSWFKQLLHYVQSRDSCQPELGI